MYEHVPSGVVFLIKLFFNISRNVLQATVHIMTNRKNTVLVRIKYFQNEKKIKYSQSLVDISEGSTFHRRITLRFDERKKLRTFSMLYIESAWAAQSTASCCISSDMSAFLITAFLCSLILYKGFYNMNGDN